MLHVNAGFGYRHVFQVSRTKIVPHLAALFSMGHLWEYEGPFTFNYLVPHFTMGGGFLYRTAGPVDFGLDVGLPLGYGWNYDLDDGFGGFYGGARINFMVML